MKLVVYFYLKTKLQFDDNYTIKYFFSCLRLFTISVIYLFKIEPGRFNLDTDYFTGSPFVEVDLSIVSRYIIA